MKTDWVVVVFFIVLTIALYPEDIGTGVGKMIKAYQTEMSR